MYCPKCGTQNADNATQCVKCGEVLQPAAAAPPPSSVPPSPPLGQQPAQQVPNYLVQSILVTVWTLITCCLPVGVVAIIYSAQVNGKVAVGDYAGAKASSDKAKMWCWIAFGVGCISAVLGLIYFLVVGFTIFGTHR